MSIPDYARLKARIDSLIDRAKECDDDAILGMQAKLLCILVTAYLDKAVLHTFYEYIKSVSYKNELANFFSRRFFTRGLRNVDYDKLETLLKDFSDLMYDNFYSCIKQKNEGNALGDKINSAVRARNKLAHGDEHPVSLLQVKEWLKAIDKLLECLRQTFSV